MISTSLFAQPWAISRPHFDALCSRLTEWMALAPSAGFQLPPSIPESAGSGYSVENGVATVPIKGVLMHAPDAWEKHFFGAVDMEQVQNSLEAAASDQSAHAILLDVDSPGGTVLGTPELANAVKAASASKPLAAFTSGLMASAAFWVGSQADAVFATPSARVGSIGVILQIPNRVEQLRKAGIKVETFSAGKYKGAGSPVIELSDEHRAMFQEGVSAIHAEFKQAVQSRRVAAQAADMEGQDFPGSVAAQKGLVSGIVQSLSGARAKLNNSLS